MVTDNLISLQIPETVHLYKYPLACGSLLWLIRDSDICGLDLFCALKYIQAYKQFYRGSMGAGSSLISFPDGLSLNPGLIWPDSPGSLTINPIEEGEEEEMFSMT